MSFDWKKGILTAGLVLTTVLPNYNSKADTLQNDVSKQITVRKNVGSKYFCTRQEVEKQLDELCRDKDINIEDAWMFYHDTLIDVGFLEDAISVNIDEIMLYTEMSKIKQGDTLILYHIHPNSYHKNIFSPPSITDVMNHASIKPRCDYNGIKLIERVFDGRGMWEFDVHDNIIQKINKDEQSKKEEYICIGLVITRSNTWSELSKQFDVTNMFMKTDPYNPSAVSEYINNVRKVGVELKFTPTEQIGK